MFPKKIDQDFVKQLLLLEEGDQLEFKQQINSQEKIAKTLSAFSNSKGGILVIGISDQRKIVGIDQEEERYMITAANDSFCIPRVSLEIKPVTIDPEYYLEDEKMVLVVLVHASLGPRVFVKQKNDSLKAYCRIGNQSKVLE
jgi:predicted HTH transcriptional regulator